jgi:hypothetical protein
MGASIVSCNDSFYTNQIHVLGLFQTIAKVSKGYIQMYI